MIKYGTIICIILSTQIIAAFYFMLQCYDGNVFAKPIEATIIIKIEKSNFLKSQIQENEFKLSSYK